MTNYDRNELRGDGKEIEPVTEERMEGDSHYEYEVYRGENGKFTTAKCDQGPCQGRERQYFNRLRVDLPVSLSKEKQSINTKLEIGEFGIVAAQGDNRDKAGKGHLWESGSKWESQELSEEITDISDNEKLEWSIVPDTKKDRGGNKTVEHQVATLDNGSLIHNFSITEGAGQGRKWACLEVPHIINISKGKKKSVKVGLGVVTNQGDISDKHRSPVGTTHVENLGMEDYKK